MHVPAPDADSADEGKLATRLPGLRVARFPLLDAGIFFARCPAIPQDTPGNGECAKGRPARLAGRGDDPGGVTMLLTVNGEQGDYADDLTVAGLLDQRGHDAAVVVVERNGGIVPAADFATTRLEAGDMLELVQFVGGG